MILDEPSGKTKYYALHTEFQERGSPYVIRIFSAPNIQENN